MIAPPPIVKAILSWANHTRLYAMKPRKFCDGLSRVPPWHTTPVVPVAGSGAGSVPNSQPASKVKVKAAFVIAFCG